MSDRGNGFPWTFIPAPEAGEKVEGTFSWDNPVFDGIHVPYIAIRGRQDGFAVAVTAAIHGGEYPGPAGALGFAQEVDPADVSGSILILPLINQTSFWARTAFTTPEDGKNLNRQFPGDENGTFTQILAHHIYQEVILLADILIDLHSGDVFESLADFTGVYRTGNTAVDSMAERLSLAFACKYAQFSPAPTPPGRMLTAVSALAGKPTVLVEVGGNGLLFPENITTVHGGLKRALRAAEVLPGDPQPETPSTRIKGGASITASATGLWWPKVTLEEQVKEGDLLGVQTDMYGHQIQEYHAPESGLVLYHLSSLAAHEGDPLVRLAQPIEE
jgi:uncharacterized protein